MQVYNAAEDLAFELAFDRDTGGVQFAIHRPAFLDHDCVGGDLSINMPKQLDKTGNAKIAREF